MPNPIVVVGALDTKGTEFQFVRSLIRENGLETILVDFGVMGDPSFKPDVTADDLVGVLNEFGKYCELVIALASDLVASRINESH